MSRNLFSKELLPINSPLAETKINPIKFSPESPESPEVDFDFQELDSLLSGGSKKKKHTKEELQEFKDIRVDVENSISKRHAIALHSPKTGLAELKKIIDYNNAIADVEVRTGINKKEIEKKQKHKTKRNLYNLCTYDVTDNRNPSPILDAKLYTINSVDQIFNELLQTNAHNSTFSTLKDHHGTDNLLFLQGWEEEHGLRYVVTFENQKDEALPTRQLRVFFEGAPSRNRPTHGQGTGDPNQNPGIKATTAGKFYINSAGKIYKVDNNSGGFKPKFESIVWPLLILHLTNPELLADTIELFEILKDKTKPGRTIFIRKDDLSMLVPLLNNQEQEKIQKDNLLPASEATIKLQYDRREQDRSLPEAGKSRRRQMPTESFAKTNKNFWQRMNHSSELSPPSLRLTRRADSLTDSQKNSMSDSPYSRNEDAFASPQKLPRSATTSQAESARTSPDSDESNSSSDLDLSILTPVSLHSNRSTSDSRVNSKGQPKKYSLSSSLSFSSFSLPESKSLDDFSDLSDDSSKRSPVLDEVRDNLESDDPELNEPIDSSFGSEEISMSMETPTKDSRHSILKSTDSPSDKTPVKNSLSTQSAGFDSPSMSTPVKRTPLGSLRSPLGFDSPERTVTPKKPKFSNDENSSPSSLNTPVKEQSSNYSPGFMRTPSPGKTKMRPSSESNDASELSQGSRTIKALF